MQTVASSRSSSAVALAQLASEARARCAARDAPPQIRIVQEIELRSHG